VGYLDWRMWGLRRWFHDELSSSAMADGGHSGRARGQAGLGFICAEDGGGQTGSVSSQGRHGCRGNNMAVELDDGVGGMASREPGRARVGLVGR
jgi:hypothetical protein